MSPKTSVIVPTFNHARFLPEAIRSVQEQIFKDWELVIVDDGSTDNTEKVVKPFLGDNRVQYIKRPHQGRSAARNYGLRQAKGELITFLDADDLLKPSFLERQITILHNHPENDLSYCDVGYFRDDCPSKVIKRRYPKFCGEESFKIIRQNSIPLPSALMKRRVVMELGGFNKTLEISEEWELWIRMVLSGSQFYFLDEVLCLARVHGGNTIADWKKHHIAQKQFRELVRPLILTTKDPKLQKEWRLTIGLFDYQEGGLLLLTGEEQSGTRGIFFRALLVIAQLDLKRLLKGVATHAFSFLPRRLRRKIGLRILPFISPYYSISAADSKVG